MIRPIRWTGLATVLLAIGSMGGDCVSGLGVFGPTVRVVIVNNTSYRATPDLRISDSSNFFEDLITEADPVTNFGSGGTVSANSTATLILPCDDDLQAFIFNECEFDQNGSGVGDVDDSETLRREDDFDCGDTIRITLSGSIFNFDATVAVDP